MLVMPLAFIFILFIGWFIDTIRIHSVIEGIVSESGNKMVCYSYAYEAIDNGEGDVEECMRAFGTNALFRFNLEREIAESDVGDKVQIYSCILDDMSDESAIRIKVIYRVFTPVSVPGFKGMLLSNTFYSKKYCGKRSVEKCSEYVYVTRGSDVYHISKECTGLKATVETVLKSSVDKKRNKDGKKYYACDRCENSEKAYVYITPYGNRYHGDPECSNLKVLVRKIPKSEMGDRKLCYFCE